MVVNRTTTFVHIFKMLETLMLHNPVAPLEKNAFLYSLPVTSLNCSIKRFVFLLRSSIDFCGMVTK